MNDNKSEAMRALLIKIGKNYGYFYPNVKFSNSGFVEDLGDRACFKCQKNLSKGNHAKDCIVAEIQNLLGFDKFWKSKEEPTDDNQQ